MKSIFALILSAFMAIMPVMGETAVEETVAEVYMIEGVIAQNDENGILVNTMEMGDVLVQVSDETIFEGAETLEAGDYIYVDYSGMMTRSLPPQITAQVVRCWRMDGIVSEVFAEENAMLINTETHGDVYVHLPAVDAEAQTEAEAPAMPAAGDDVTVWFNGIMTMSLPGQINAGQLLIHTAEAA